MTAITAGRLRPGETVPSTRAMARQLRVSRNTVTLAYQALVAEGFLCARERSGFYVDDLAVDGLTPSPDRGVAQQSGLDWAPRMVKRIGGQRFIQRPADWQEVEFPFIYGQVDQDIFPIAEWRDCVRQAMGKRWLDAWTLDQYGSDDPLLIEQIAERILPRRGIDASADNILITLGAQNALYLIAALLVGQETRCVIEDPGYPDLRNMLELRSDRIVTKGVDAEGMLVDDAMDGGSLIFCTPSHHYPTTVTMSLARRKALLAAASAQDSVIVEDDYEFETNYKGAPQPALKSLDTEGRVIYVGSLSKSLMPGLRLGFIVADPALIEQLRTLRRLMLRHPPGNNQRAAALFMANGHYDVLVRRIHRVYRTRWEALHEAVRARLPGWAEAPGFGGSSFWMTGPDDLDSKALADRALARGVLIEPGDPFFINPGDGANCFRLGFSSIPEEKIAEGIDRLVGAMEP
ncbi:PLP-dependent aminotransferase family protein [Rhodobacteraceae bacterium NNCM2]|nr:PLP-dependent aminotransferase family protein [Coraliihabitans acroporae]